MTKPIPDGWHTVTPHLVIRGAADALSFYEKAFGAKLEAQMPMPDGKLMHAELKIGDSTIMLADEFPEMGSQSPQGYGGSPVSLHLYVEDVDAAFQRAVDAGAKALQEPTDMFWGDRYGRLEDPFGHQWAMATHKEDLTPEQMAKRGQEAMAAFKPS